ncbi:enoyl-CoA hydratase/isomerase family protein [Peptoniphilus equinus]|uniref:3-hydroxyisobutyryl-CoA hydrolase n=1 Tax=Peptoniphilus equinus TaxID=3016343 RepID=A0ABY7QV60_9FIRM|nr:enoyl-CoA hydratase/isomerase family protein [Peptoniphilus equinus]WBW50661.1 enoyl-CoA hydratase/isomerase family protein [Peptoniphilus equinus]
MIQTTIENGVAVIRLNRDEKLNALNFSMILELQDLLHHLAEDAQVKGLVLKGGSKAFCAGGDVVDLYKHYIIRGKDPNPFFATEFKVDNQIETFPKPVVALVHGITMGGGVGLSCGADFIVADETTTWAMPETRLGIVPDVGVGYYLSKLPRPVALYLSLLGVSITGSDMMKLGLATHYVKSKSLIQLESDLIACGMATTADIRTVLDAYRVPTVTTALDKAKSDIDRYFDSTTLEALLDNLSKGSDWGKDVYQWFQDKSPLSLKLVFGKYDVGKALTRQETFEMDEKILDYCYVTGNMGEGIRAAMIDKDPPHFKPTSVQDVDDDVVSRLLSKRERVVK